MDYQRAKDMRILSQVKKLHSFLNSPDFDKHRYDSMLNQLTAFINSADFTDEVIFYYPRELVNGWIFSDYKVHPWLEDTIYHANLYIDNLILEASKHGFKISRYYDGYCYCRLAIEPKM